MRNAAGELDHLEAALHLAIGVGQDLAVLPGDDGGEFLAVALQQFLEFEHHAGAAQRRGGSPGGPCGGGGGDGGVDFGGAGQSDASDYLAGGRIVDVAEFAAGAGRWFAADEMPDFLHWPILRVASEAGLRPKRAGRVGGVRPTMGSPGILENNCGPTVRRIVSVSCHCARGKSGRLCHARPPGRADCTTALCSHG